MRVTVTSRPITRGSGKAWKTSTKAIGSPLVRPLSDLSREVRLLEAIIAERDEVVLPSAGLLFVSHGIRLYA